MSREIAKLAQRFEPRFERRTRAGFVDTEAEFNKVFEVGICAASSANIEVNPAVNLVVDLVLCLVPLSLFTRYGVGCYSSALRIDLKLLVLRNRLYLVVFAKEQTRCNMTMLLRLGGSSVLLARRATLPPGKA
ncbi:hypothetical protein N7523_005434 [Penicillium sp. IBT 18751x]|nr:hypothetical protein N7523_005434 [Penicillium sp. IBT 18751x]